MVDTATTNYPQDPYRFVIITAYLLANLVNSVPVNTFSSINVIVQDTFKLTDIQVTLNALLFTISHPFFSVPCNWLINKHGMRISFILGAVLVVSGVWLRLLLDVQQSIYCLLGSLLAAIGNIFILNTPSKVAVNWFSKEKTGIVTFTGILITLLSIAIGASLPTLFIDKNTSVQDIRTFLFWQAVAVSIPMILLAVLFRERPKQPPSKVAAVIFTQERQGYKQLLKKLFKNKEYLKLVLTMSFNYGTVSAIIMVLDQLLAGLGYQNSGKIYSLTIVSVMGFGIISNPFFSYLLRKSKAYRAVAALVTFGTFIMVCLLLLGFIIKIDGTVSFIILGGLVGIFFMPLPSVIVSYSSEVVFPIDQGSSAGFLFATSQTFGFIVGFSSISFLNRTPIRSEIVAYIFMGLQLLSFLTAIWVKEDLKKWEFQKSHYRPAPQDQKPVGSLLFQDKTLK